MATNKPNTFWSRDDERKPKQIKEVKKATTPRSDHIMINVIKALGGS